MTNITNEQLINEAIDVLNPKMAGDRLFGDVGCTLWLVGRYTAPVRPVRWGRISSGI